ncbi:MAG: hypothetical protein ACUBOA_00985 [Candidatus Loosdrechtia sp.]|uniref:hypothetical protein n=1 Tax=Candidatus Loosdrechtia sp. TaxID=3101272 RepID=UPI003A79CAA1|nr:MAG: hypothetical protein QY305_07825 [Candidatus Jettenia sp. AMX2]
MKFTMGFGFKEKTQRASRWLVQKTSLISGDNVGCLRISKNPLAMLKDRHVPRHVSLAMVYTAAANGMFINAGEITRFTRGLMDHDGAAIQQLLRRIFDPETAREISIWMDTAPGAEYAGGWAHRLTHGHDLSALLELTFGHGHIGIIEWLNHVWLRDFWTPHGVPYLPAGAGSAYDCLVSNFGISPSTALSLLTINVAEAASGLLIFCSCYQIYRGLISFAETRDYKKRLKQIEKLVNEGSNQEALSLAQETEIYANHERASHLRLALAMFCLNQSFQSEGGHAVAWGNQAFSIARELCRSSPHLPVDIPYHGNTRVSFQGLAATIMASAYSSHLQGITPDWSDISERIQFGIRRFLELSKIQSKPRLLKVNGKHLWGYRPYSALTNQLLALELSISCGSLHTMTIDPITIRQMMEKLLNNLQQKGLPHLDFTKQLTSDIQQIYPLTV